MKQNNGIFYFLGNIPSHGLHAISLYKKIGGTFVVTSQKSLETIQSYGVDVVMLEDKPEINLNFGYNIPKTIKYLNRNARVVLFYEIYGFPLGMRLTKPKTIFLTHGNILKQYLNTARLKALKQYDYMVGLGPYNKYKFINEFNIPQQKILDLGIARTDEVIAHKGKVYKQKEINKLLGFKKNQPIITYMPTYWGASSVHNVGRDIVRNIPDDYNVIFRPHPQTPEVIIYEYLNIIDSKRDRIAYATEGTFKEISLTDTFNASTLIIGDISSVMLEAILIDKPLIFAYDSGGKQQSEKDIESIKDIVDFSCRIDINNVMDIDRIINNALKRGINPIIWQRTKDYTFFHNDGKSVQSIANFVKTLA